MDRPPKGMSLRHQSLLVRGSTELDHAWTGVPIAVLVLELGEKEILAIEQAGIRLAIPAEELEDAITISAQRVATLDEFENVLREYQCITESNREAVFEHRRQVNADGIILVIPIDSKPFASLWSAPGRYLAEES